MYKIGEFAAMTGMSISKVRFYDKRGLFSGSREENGYRMFEPEDAFRANAFRVLLQYGFTVDEAITMVDEQQGGEEFRLSLEGQYRDLERRMELLKWRMTKLTSALELIDNGDDPDFTLVDMPDQMYVRASHGRDFSVSVENANELAEFYELLSITSCARIIEKADLENDHDTIDPSYINVIAKSEVYRLEKADRTHLEQLSLGKCIRFRRRVTREESVRKETFADLLAFLDDHGYQVRNDIILYPTFLNLDGQGSDIETLYVPVR